MKKKLYEVLVSLECVYEIEAENEDEAKEKAWDYFEGCKPDFEIMKVWEE